MPDSNADRILAQLSDVSAEAGLSDEFRNGLLQMASDALERLDVSRARKPGTWAASIYYAHQQSFYGETTQVEAARLFGVSDQSVAAKWMQVAHAVDLVMYDPRYVPQGMVSESPMEQLASLFSSFAGLPGVPMGDLSPDNLRLNLGKLMAEARWGDPKPDAHYDAIELAFAAWERMEAGDFKGAGQTARQAIALDPDATDAHNVLGWMERDLAKAEAHHRRAVESAHRTLESVGPDDYAWWADMDTRPYMRSRQSLALILTEQARYAEAVAEYRALLALNPSDNQGMRYLVGPTLLHGGDVSAAVQAYDDYHSAYPDDSAEPDHAPLEGVARWLAGQHAKAVAAWWRALTGNLYVLPTVAGTPLPPTDLWHGSSDAVPEVAEEHLGRYEEIWERDTDARDALVRFLQHDLVRQRVERRVAWHRELDTLRSDTDDGLAGRQRLAQQLHTDSLSDAEARRIAQAIA